MKGLLKNYAAGPLTKQLNSTMGDGFVRSVDAGYSGIYQWSINFNPEDSGVPFNEAPLQLKFGPSAWFANEQDPEWKATVDPQAADYEKVFVTRAGIRRIRQSPVTLREVLDGLDPGDTRLHDEMILLIRSA